MSARPLVVIGGGEHARVVIECARSRADLFQVIGFSDLRPCAETSSRLSLPWLGDDDAVLAAHARSAGFVLGIGCVGPSPVRSRVAARYTQDSVDWMVVVHRSACVSPTATLGGGTVVMAGAIVNTGARLGAHAVINTGAVVEHDVIIGDFCQIGPGAVLGGGAAVGDNCILGLGCSIRDHVAVGANALVGMGAAVIADVPSGAIVTGVPARPQEPSRG